MGRLVNLSEKAGPARVEFCRARCEVVPEARVLFSPRTWGRAFTSVTRMLFQQGSDRYDTSDMLSFETGLPNMPSVYLTRDQRRVFVLTIGYKGVAVHEADAAEVEGLVRRLGLEQLRAALAGGQ